MAEDQPSTSGIPDEFYRTLWLHAPLAMIATDAEFRIVCANATAGRLLGMAEADMLGKPMWVIVPANRRRLLERLLHRTMGRGESTQFDVRLPDSSGKLRNLAVTLASMPDAQGRPQGVAAWVIDETHRKQLSDRLAHVEKMASLGTLAGGIAHHFNNILGGVATFVDYALTSEDLPAMKRALQMTAEAAARASKITQSLLSFATKDHKHSDMADLTEVVLTFVNLVERPLSEQNIKIHMDLKPVPMVAVEANRMHQVLGNLLTNAEEAMPEGGTVTVTLGQSDSDVRLTFSDTGCGIEPKHLPLVFEPFFTTKGLLAGGDKANPGLGLSIVHGIVTEMGGTISVKSRLGESTEFAIALPPQGQSTA